MESHVITRVTVSSTVNQGVKEGRCVVRVWYARVREGLSCFCSDASQLFQEAVQQPCLQTNWISINSNDTSHVAGWRVQ
jgi:hypothetical protein